MVCPRTIHFHFYVEFYLGNMSECIQSITKDIWIIYIYEYCSWKKFQYVSSNEYAYIFPCGVFLCVGLLSHRGGK